MQSERRHDLEQNDLAEATVTVFERVRPHLGMIGAVVGAAFVALAAVSLRTSWRQGQLARAWDEALTAMQNADPDALARVADSHPGTAAAAWCRLLRADAALDDGTRLWTGDRAGARERFEAAADDYAALLAAQPRGVVAERAAFGLARVREHLGELAEARRGYATLADEHPDSPLAGVAAARAASLADPATERWYDWFRQQSAAAAPSQPPAADAPPAADQPPADGQRPAPADPAAEPAAESGAPAGG